MTDMVEVKHEGIKGTAFVPVTALKNMAPGWTPVDSSDAPQGASEGDGTEPDADKPGADGDPGTDQADGTKPSGTDPKKGK